jgi:hypothetical protein
VPHEPHARLRPVSPPRFRLCPQSRAARWFLRARLCSPLFPRYARYVRLFYNDPTVHTLLSVPFVGHCLCGIFQNEPFYAVLRGDGERGAGRSAAAAAAWAATASSGAVAAAAAAAATAGPRRPAV